jgi:hypothetical protein
MADELLNLVDRLMAVKGARLAQSAPGTANCFSIQRLSEAAHALEDTELDRQHLACCARCRRIRDAILRLDEADGSQGPVEPTAVSVAKP